MDVFLHCDLIFLLGHGWPVWHDVAFYTLAGGIVGALLAAIPGFIDWLSIDEKQMKSLGLIHMLVNLGAVLIFAIDLWLRTKSPAAAKLPVALSALGVLLTGIGGWYGGEMVYVKGMAVEAVEILAKQKNRK